MNSATEQNKARLGSNRRAGFRNRAGLSFIELMVAVAIGSIVMLATSAVLVYGQRSWDRTLQQASLQREASLAMLRVKQWIRNGTKAELDEDAQGVTINHTAGSIRFWFEPGQHDLLFQIDAQDPQTLLDGIVETASFAVDATTGKTVTVGFELVNGCSETRLASTTLMRNYSGT